MANRVVSKDTHEFTCDICGKPGLSAGRKAKRHKECTPEYRRRYYYAYHLKRFKKRSVDSVVSYDETRSAQAIKADAILHRLGLNPAMVRSHCRDIRIALGQNNTTPKIYVRA